MLLTVLTENAAFAGCAQSQNLTFVILETRISPWLILAEFWTSKE
jgi:hypothetical protein